MTSYGQSIHMNKSNANGATDMSKHEKMESQSAVLYKSEWKNYIDNMSNLLRKKISWTWSASPSDL